MGVRPIGNGLVARPQFVDGAGKVDRLRNPHSYPAGSPNPTKEEARRFGGQCITT